jgi:hypothetical protein
MEEKEKKIERVKEILREHDIKIDVGGCGCCGSPFFSFEYKGEKIIDDEDYCNIDMFGDNAT